MDSLAALSAALLRMHDGPTSKRRAVDEIHQTVLQNYLITFRIAAIRLLLRNHAEALQRDAIGHWLEQACRVLEQARKTLSSSLSSNVAEHTMSAVDASSNWTGWQPLQRRSRLMEEDVKQTAVRAALIARAWGRVERRLAWRLCNGHRHPGQAGQHDNAWSLPADHCHARYPAGPGSMRWGCIASDNASRLLVVIRCWRTCRYACQAYGMLGRRVL